MLFLLAAVQGCVKESCPDEMSGNGTGNLTLNFGTAPEVSLTKGGRTAGEGNLMNKLSIWIVRRSDGMILVHEHLLDRGTVIEPSTTTKDAPILAEIDFAEDGKTAQMKFIDVPRGNCTLYAVANFDELDHGKYVVGAKIDDAFRNMLINETAIADGESPKFDGEGSLGMPCSATVDFAVGAGENKISVEMERCVGRITVYIRNNIAESAIFIDQVGLSRNNPSLGYVFRHEGGSIPEQSSPVSFPELQGLKKIVALTTDPVEVFDTYLYETTPEENADEFTFNIFGAVYKAATEAADVSIGYRQEYRFGAYSADIAPGGMFLISSAISSNYYIGDETEGLNYRFFSGDTELKHHRGIENYFWTFSGKDNTLITNVGTGRSISLNGQEVSMTAAGSAFDVKKENIGNVSSLRFSAGGYSLTITPDEGIDGSTGKESEETTHWLTRSVKKVDGGETGIPYFINADYEIPRVERAFTYIDQYGIAQILRNIRRNEHIKLVIGIYYNRETAQFNFAVEPWTEKKSETTFD